MTNKQIYYCIINIYYKRAVPDSDATSHIQLHIFMEITLRITLKMPQRLQLQCRHSSSWPQCLVLLPEAQIHTSLTP